MTAVTIQSNKIALNDVKTTKHYWSHRTKKKNVIDFLANPALDFFKKECKQFSFG